MSSTVGCIVTVLLLDVTLGANDASFNEWATFLEQGDLEKQHVQYRISDINNSLDYFNAQSYCEAVGGYLAEPKTEDEIKILRVIKITKFFFHKLDFQAKFSTPATNQYSKIPIEFGKGTFKQHPSEKICRHL